MLQGLRQLGVCPRTWRAAAWRRMLSFGAWHCNRKKERKMMISSRHLSRQRLSPLAHLANVSILWPIWLCGSAWLRCPGRPLSVAPTHPAAARLELQTLRWVPRPTLDPELQLESQSVLPLAPFACSLCLPYANYEQATSHAPPKLNLDAQISTCPTKRLCPRLWHRFRLLSSDLRESQRA